MEKKFGLNPYVLLGYVHEQLGIYFWIVLCAMLVVHILNSVFVKEFWKTIRCYIKTKKATSKDLKKAKKNHKLRQ